MHCATSYLYSKHWSFLDHLDIEKGFSSSFTNINYFNITLKLFFHFETSRWNSFQQSVLLLKAHVAKIAEIIDFFFLIANLIIVMTLHLYENMWKGFPNLRPHDMTLPSSVTWHCTWGLIRCINRLSRII